MNLTLANLPAYHLPAEDRSDEPDENSIVSILTVDGKSVVVSRYGDLRWRFIGLPTNSSASQREVNFETIAAPWREVMKAILWRYMRRGHDGSKVPSPRSVVKLLGDARPFLLHLDRLAIRRFADVTPFACATYVEYCKQHRQAKGSARAGNLLKPSSLGQRFGAVEALYSLSQHTNDAIPSHPWPETSATHLSGLTGRGTGYRGGKTPLIPDTIFAAIFQKAWTQLENADDILSVRDELVVLREAVGKKNVAEGEYVRRFGWSDMWEFNKALLALRTACYIVVASLSGCRNHEIAFVEFGACYATERDDDGGDPQTYWWMRSQSTKTGEGKTEWMVPEAAVRALAIMDRWAAPYQRLLEQEIEDRRKADPADPEIAEAQLHKNAVFLGLSPKNGNQVRTMSLQALNISLKEFVKEHGISWALASHQFRRKFANYAARSQFGDLRYLRSHFKHWSMDMTLGYALNESQEIALYAEIQLELDSLKEEVVESWLKPDALLAGGYGKNIASWRGHEAVTLFKSHQHMVKSLAESTRIRSNGHAWCTADEGRDCPGNDLERTRCGGCSEGVIGVLHAPIYKGLQDHLMEVVAHDDIGNGGRSMIRRDLDRCGGVLVTLGLHDAAGTIA